MIDLLVEILGDAAEESPLDSAHWELLNEIVYNEIPPIPDHLRNMKDRHRTKRALLEMM